MAEPKQSPLQKKLQEIRRMAEERGAGRLADELGYSYIDLRKTSPSSDALKLLPENEAREAEVVPLKTKENEIALAAVNPRGAAFKKIEQFFGQRGYKIKIFISSLSGLQEFWRYYQFVPPTAKEITGRIEIEKKKLEELMSRLTNFSEAQRAIKNFNFQKLGKSKSVDLLEIILTGAVVNYASDIHLEPTEKTIKIRFRLDGVLRDVFEGIPPRAYEGLISRIKLLSGLKINIHDEPQDGRFTVTLVDKEIEARVSVIPSEYGETIVMRLLDPLAISRSLNELGLREDDLMLVKTEIAKPNGLILNTGPTGSGKTTTLYAFLRQIVSPEIKIITIEDPIEYRLQGIEQTQVDPEAGYTFANGLRSIMRQDPDIILVGEIRDLETADIALQAALTGHLVFSTLHTNDAVGAVPRLLDLGVKSLHIGPALNLIIAQRLVRRLCRKCRKRVFVSEEMRKKIKRLLDKLPPRVNRKQYDDFKIYEAVGCAECGDTGYKGRIGIFEFLEAGAEFEELILREASEVSLKKLAVEQGIVEMQEDGILKVLSGDTDFAELERVTGEIKWS